MEYIIRETTIADFDAVMEVEKQAFGYDKETKLVAQLLSDKTTKPLTVKPAYQRQGIDGMLIKEGLRLLQSMGTEIVFVLGHKEYYPKKEHPDTSPTDLMHR